MHGNLCCWGLVAMDGNGLCGGTFNMVGAVLARRYRSDECGKQSYRGGKWAKKDGVGA